ncbi:MAG: adenylate/guanylate cyclase domain-containing protein, partial [bacterium]|nr:adenylate/guanylate cyclase domain-containing protein [bacterium]
MSQSVPSFILEQYKKRKLSGSFNGYSMFLDITGFTSITEKLMSYGKEGAEILSGTINRIYDPVIKEIYLRNGYISSFAGDAFTAIFNTSEDIINSAHAIISIFQKEKHQKTKFGKFSLSASIGISYGKIDWGIVGGENKKNYYYSGDAIKRCMQSEHLASSSEIILDSYFLKNLKTSELSLKKIGPNNFKLIPGEFPPAKIKKKIPVQRKSHPGDFLPDSIPVFPSLGEFRNVVSVFVEFRGKNDWKSLNHFFTQILTKIDKYGGYLNNIEFSPEKKSFSVFWGIPLTYENILNRALDFSLSLKDEFKAGIKTGITYGTVYSGFIGSNIRAAYSCIGDLVNLAARLVSKSRSGTIVLNKSTAIQSQPQYNLQKLGAFKYKGKSSAVTTYKLLNKNKTRDKHETTQFFFGRETEQKSIVSFLNPIFKSDFAGILYVYGQPGIGKSKLIEHSLEEEKEKRSFQVFLMQTDQILKSSLNPVTYFLNDFFSFTSTHSPILKEKAFKRKIESIFKIKIKNRRAETLKQSIRSKLELIGLTLGIDYKDSAYNSFEPKLRNELTRYAICDLIKYLSLIKPAVIIIEDFHWIDEDSALFFKDLLQNLKTYPIALIATSRLNDDGTKPKLKLSTLPKISEMTLEKFSFKATKQFIENILNKPVHPELVGYLNEKTGGNPFYLGQFCLYLIENNLLTEKTGLLLLKIKTDEIPLNINNIIISRIDRLSDEIKNILQVASVIGLEF